jgi:hypothetical protein
VHQGWLIKGYLIVGAAACFAALGYGLAMADNVAGVTMFIAFPAFAAGIFIVGLFLPQAQRTGLALCVTSITVATYVGELALGALYPHVYKSGAAGWPRPDHRIMARAAQARVRTARAFGIEYDARSVLEVVADLQKTSRDVQPAVFPVNVNVVTDRGGALQPAVSIAGRPVLPLGGIANVLTVFCNEGGTYVTYESDEHGFNNPRGLWTPGAVDIAAVGDSFTHGMCVSPQENFMATIRHTYAKTLNLGMSGSGPLLMLGEVREYLTTIRPRVVLWFFVEGNDEPSGNDLTDLRAERNSPILMRYLWSDGYRQGLLDRQVEIDGALKDYLAVVTARGPSFLRQAAALYHLRTALSLLRGVPRNDGYSEIERDLFEQVILRAKATVAAWGGQLYVVYLPDFARYAKSGALPPNPDRARILAFLRTAGVPVIDVHEAFLQQADALDLFPFRIRGHYNERGHRVVAETVLKSVTLAPQN